jgi:CSLREA domain-containing protein
MRWLLVAVLALALGGAAAVRPAASDGPAVITVTSAADEGGACPGSATCTLRAAIEAANAASGDVVIRFSPAVFPAGEPAVIAVGTAGLPPLTRDGAVIDGTGAGVVIRAGATGLASPLDGLRLDGAATAVRGLRLEGFTGACVVATGAGVTVGGSAGNELRSCGVGVRAAGEGVVVAGNQFVGPAEGSPSGTGVEVRAADARVGGLAGNRFERLAVGVRVTAGAGLVAGVNVEGNAFADIGGPCVDLGAGTTGATVTGNQFTACGTGVVVAPAEGDRPASERNTIRGNTFASLAGLAIDIGGDGRRNPPGSVSANGGIEHPVIDRATVSTIVGVACPGCTVEIYLANHTPGGDRDFGTVPLGPPVNADSTGRFTAPAQVSPGQWVIATATDAAGNTSEFGPPSRVGAGSILCGNVQLTPGWNHVAYFGSQPLILGDSFPGGGSSMVTAIYQAIDGTTSYRRWLAATPAGRTLTALEPGQEYWFLAAAPVSLQGGFSVSFPVPVQLSAGWNDVVYMGGSADPRDAFASIGNRLLSVAKWDAVTQRWLRFGDGSAPPWAVGFAQVESCGVYQLLVSESATLVPLQP